MNILYFSWNEFIIDDTLEAIKNTGNTVDILSIPIVDYDFDKEFEDKFLKKLMNKNYDFVFTWDYLPIISRICQKKSIRYISWVYDCPHFTLSSDTLSNTCNNVFVFDSSLVYYYNRLGFNNVKYMPLATNVNRMDKVIVESYDKDITFLGNLYNYSNFDKIDNLPDYVKGYVDSLVMSQIQIFGYDITENTITDNIIKEIEKHVEFMEIGNEYFLKNDYIIRNMIRKKITQFERIHYIEKISQRFNMDLYTHSEYNGLKNATIHKGFVDYMDICKIYKSSKINFNITIRSILSGIPFRIIDIIGANSFLLTNYQSELSYYFENMKDIVWYDSLNDCLDKIDYFLKHDEEREKIKENGYKKIKENFSFEVKFSEILDIVFK